MPVCADPKSTVPYVLEGDRAEPQPQPTFHLKFLTSQEARRVDPIFTAACEETRKDAAADEVRIEQLLDQLIGECVVRSENVRFAGQPVTPTQKPSGYLTPVELWELATACVREPRLKESDRKKSSSPSTSAAAACATSAEAAGSAAAPTPATASSSAAPPATADPAGATNATTLESTS